MLAKSAAAHQNILRGKERDIARAIWASQNGKQGSRLCVINPAPTFQQALGRVALSDVVVGTLAWLDLLKSLPVRMRLGHIVHT
jgi:hypothetical protein